MSVMKQTNPSNHVMPVFLFVCLFSFVFFVVLFSAFILFSKTCHFPFPSALNEKLKFDLVHVIVKIKGTSLPETIADAMGQIIRVTKGLANFNSERFPKPLNAPR